MQLCAAFCYYAICRIYFLLFCSYINMAQTHVCSFVQRFVIMLFVEFTFCYFEAISTWLKHTHVALCSVLLLCDLSNLLFVILKLYQHGSNTRMLLCAAFCYYAICRIYFLLIWSYINMAQTHACCFVQRFVIMLFAEFTFCYFEAISTWLKHTYEALCSVLLLYYLSNLLFVILKLYQHGSNTRMLLCAAFCYYAICRIYFLLFWSYINMAQTHVCRFVQRFVIMLFVEFTFCYF